MHAGAELATLPRPVQDRQLVALPMQSTHCGAHTWQSVLFVKVSQKPIAHWQTARCKLLFAPKHEEQLFGVTEQAEQF
jgi:hypothetical protein